MATTLQHCAAAAPSPAAATPASATNGNNNASKNPQLKRIVYSKYRELLGSYNGKANAIIETLPAYMVREDHGFHCEPVNGATTAATLNTTGKSRNAAAAQANVADAACFLQQVAAAAAAVAAAQGERATDEMYGGAAGQKGYEAPTCVQNAMMTKDKKPFTYTPGGIDLSQIKSERMAKRLARNAQAEGATGAQQLNRPTQPQSPGGGASNGTGGAVAAMGAAAMGMPFQVLPPPPPPSSAMAAGKNTNGTPAPPPPPPSSSTLAPPTKNGGPGSAPGSPNAPRKSPTPQRFEPPPMGFRPEIKIPPNPMASLRKVPPPVEKNTFWKDEYVRDRSKSPMVGDNDRASSPGNGAQGSNVNANSNNNDNVDGFKKSMPAAATTTTNTQQPETNYNGNNNQQYAPPQPTYSPPAAYQQQQQQQQAQYSTPTSAAVPPAPAQQQPVSPRPEFRSVPVPQSPAVNVYTRQSDNPRAEATTPPQLATEGPSRYGQPQQQRAAPAISPLAQQQQQQTQKTYAPTTAAAPAPTSAPSNAQTQPQSQTVPWRTQRSQQPPQTTSQPQQQQQQQQTHAQPIYNNIQTQQQQQQPYSTQQQPYQGPKPTNVGSLYIAPLAPPTEPQAQHIVRQQMQQHQQQQRDSPMRQMPQQQTQPHTQAPQMRSNVPWLSSKPTQKEQPEWVRPEENGNVVPSSLHRLKSPPPAVQSQQQPTYYQQSAPQQQTFGYQPAQGNGYAPPPVQNFGSHGNAPAGLRLQLGAGSTPSQNGPRERIIPIQLEQTPTSTPSNLNFGNGGGNVAPAGYVIRSPNQFVDQGYNNFPSASAAAAAQRVMSPTQQLNAPRIVQQQQQLGNHNNVGGARTRVIPIAVESTEGSRGPISQSPIVLQNDPRSSPIQSKSFRVLQKITDTIDDGSGDSSGATNALAGGTQDNYVDAEPQLQRPTYARQMSAQQARPQPNMEQQMRRMQIGPDQQSQQTWNQDMPQPYVHPSEQQVPEPKKYTGSAIPSRSFKILQAMTTPENAAEMEDSDCVELNENHSKISNNSAIKKVNHSENCVEIANDNSEENSAPHPSSTTSSTSSSSSNPSLNSEPAQHSMPSHTYPAFAYPYPYSWYPNNGEPIPPWHYPYAMPPPGTIASNHVPCEQTSNANYPSYPHPPPYPYYYPYYPPPPMPHTYSPHAAPPTNEYDSQNAYADPNSVPYPPYMTPYPYPYPVAPSYSQSTTSSRASSILPDIIITPSTDDVPSKVIMQHHIKVEKSEPRKRENTVEIEEVATGGAALQHAMKRQEREGSILNILTQRLENMTKVGETNLNLSKEVEKNYLGEKDKEFDEKSPTDNASPVMKHSVELASDSEDNSSDSESSSEEDSESTPKCVENKHGLQAIKSVTNIQVYRGHVNTLKADDEDDITTADGESDIFDEEDTHIGELELEQCLEENMDYIEEENLSVIYEEESELERSSEQPKTVIRRDGSNASDATTVERFGDIDQQIEENDNDDINKNDSNSVIVRLPLRFSFSRSSNDENIATVEVGESEIKERRSSISSGSKQNSFVVAKIQNDSDEEGMEINDDYDDDCEVSVTISLTGSSRSGSVDRKSEDRNNSSAYPIENIAAPVIKSDSISSSSEDVSVSFSLNMRNKFMDQTMQGDIINNISEIEIEGVQQKKDERLIEPALQSTEELDFFATLRATKLQAQKVKEQSANYWGKAAEKKLEVEEPVETTVNGNSVVKEAEVEDIWANRNDDDDFRYKKHATIHETLKEKEKVMQQTSEIDKTEKAEIVIEDESNEVSEDESEVSEEVDFWAEIAKSKNSSIIPDTNKYLQSAVREEIKKVYYFPAVLQACVKKMPEVQQAKCHIPADEDEELDSDSENEESEQRRNSESDIIKETHFAEEEEDFWASVEKAKASKVSENNFPKLDQSITDREQLAEEKTYSSLKKEESTEFLAMEIDADNQCDFWADSVDQNVQSYTENRAFDPSLYPEEPREVDTDEEIDFWAEIEAKNEGTDDVNFYKSASFWASKERQNSVEETPYTQVKPKAFPAKLPNEPTVNVSVWSGLEAAKEEEPTIIDPTIEEQEILDTDHNATPMDIGEDQQFDRDEQKFEYMPLTADDWELTCKSTGLREINEPEDIWKNNEESKADQFSTDIWTNTKAEAHITADDESNEIDEADVKRNNYRKAMAFFTTSIDEQREANGERTTRSGKSSKRNSIVEESTPKVNNETKGHSDVNRIYSPDAKQMTSNLNVASKPPKPIKLTSNELPPNVKDANTTVSYSNSSLKKERSITPSGFENHLTANATTPEVFVEPVFSKKLLPDGLPDLGLKNDEPKTSVRDRIFAFESGSIDTPDKDCIKPDSKAHSLSVESCTHKGTLSRHSSSQRSESEMEEDDSGVTDMNKPLSETDTESESFPELRKMTSYQRAATHSRLFKLLQDENDITEDDKTLSKEELQKLADEFQFKPSRRRIVHNVSITRKQNPTALTEAESMSQRRERLSLPLRKNTSIDADNPSTPNSPASPILGQPSNHRSVSDKLVNELVQSLLLKGDSTNLRRLPMEKLQAAAKRVLEEELDSLDNTSVETTPAPTPNDGKGDKSYADYYDTWSKASATRGAEVVPSKALRALQDGVRRTPWTARCPRVLSSKTVNRDLARVTESPEIITRSSKSPDCLAQSRESSVSRWKKV